MLSDQTKPRATGYLGVDTGGTFTDFVYFSEGGGRIHKVLSTPEAPEQAILQGIEELGLLEQAHTGQLHVVHGSTVATNAALEGKGVKTVYIANAGFADVLALARQNRPNIYELCPSAEPPPVPPDLCLEVDVRRNYLGEVVRPLSPQSLEQLCDDIKRIKPQAIAINLLYSFLNDEEERRIEELLEGDVFVCRSSEVLPEYKEYERGMATWLNAWLGPLVQGYLKRLSTSLAGAPLAVMQSSGGTIAAEQAAKRAVNLLLSGPAGGLAAAMHIGKQVGQTRLLTFDMGGTSTDVALLDGAIALTTESQLANYPVAVPSVDMHTIGAGGGSIAYLDAGGLLHVGPESAGAVPGPACYGRGGSNPTVTDANAVLGHLQEDFLLGGSMALDIEAANRTLEQLAADMGVDEITAAEGIVSLANEHMTKALRVISVQKGFDPREFTLCCFGGAGGLHVCALAEALSMRHIIVPANGGVLSAYGMLVAPRQRNLSKSILKILDEPNLQASMVLVDNLNDRACQELRAEGVSRHLKTEVSFDCRYQGQSYYIAVPWQVDLNTCELTDAFHQAHEANFGHQMQLPIELVNLRVKVFAESEAMPDVSGNPASDEAGGSARVVSLPKLGKTKIVSRDQLARHQQLKGPAIICEPVATTLVAPGWVAARDALGHIHLTLAAD